jgi:hypothetical protein
LSHFCRAECFHNSLSSDTTPTWTWGIVLYSRHRQRFCRRCVIEENIAAGSISCYILDSGDPTFFPVLGLTHRSSQVRSPCHPAERPTSTLNPRTMPFRFIVRSKIITAGYTNHIREWWDGMFRRTCIRYSRLVVPDIARRIDC